MLELKISLNSKYSILKGDNKMLIKSRYLNEKRIIIIYYSIFAVTTNVSFANEKHTLVFGAGITHNRPDNIFYKGEPIYIHAGIRRTDSIDISQEETLKIGDVNAPWYGNIDIKYYKLEKTSDDMQQFKKVLMRNVKMELLFGSTINELKKANESSSTTWVYEPNLTSAFLPGKYIVDITLNENRLKQYKPNISVKYLSNAIEIEIQEPNNNQEKSEVILNQGAFYSSKNKQEAAIKLFRQALELDPSKQKIHCNIGRSCELDGDIDNAIKEYQIYVDWVHSLDIPRTGGDDINLHADTIENNIKILEQVKNKKEKLSD